MRGPPLFSPVSDVQWAELSPFLAKPPRQPRRKADRKGGRPPLSDRSCFDAALWLVITGCGWRRLPREIGSRQAVSARLNNWAKGPRMTWLWQAYISTLSEDQAQALACVARPERRSPPWAWPLVFILRAHFRPEPLNYLEEQY